jgi:hypothetical protein
MKSIPMISGDEVAALTSEHKHLSFRPGERRAVKTRVARRSRQAARRDLRQGRFE